MLRPLHDYVLLKKEKEEKTTASGILLTSVKEPSKLAIVVDIGNDVKNPEYEIGSRVLYCEREGVKMEEYIVIKDADIIAVEKD